MKILIKEACLIAGETVGQHVEAGAEIDVPKDDAIYLCRSGRAAFIDKADDPTKGLLTASAEERAAAKKAKAEAAKASEQKPAS